PQFVMGTADRTRMDVERPSVRGGGVSVRSRWHDDDHRRPDMAGEPSHFEIELYPGVVDEELREEGGVPSRNLG
ncbi:MAG TPA: hypothetical protein VK875_08850, partial [Euzebyales bacterium]|nr:hypothetical protein [Euzebyales bacterium]